MNLLPSTLSPDPAALAGFLSLATPTSGGPAGSVSPGEPGGHGPLGSSMGFAEVIAAVSGAAVELPRTSGGRETPAAPADFAMRTGLEVARPAAAAVSARPAVFPAVAVPTDSVGAANQLRPAAASVPTISVARADNATELRSGAPKPRGGFVPGEPAATVAAARTTPGAKRRGAEVSGDASTADLAQRVEQDPSYDRPAPAATPEWDTARGAGTAQLIAPAPLPDAPFPAGPLPAEPDLQAEADTFNVDSSMAQSLERSPVIKPAAIQAGRGEETFPRVHAGSPHATTPAHTEPQQTKAALPRPTQLPVTGAELRGDGPTGQGARAMPAAVGEKPDEVTNVPAATFRGDTLPATRLSPSAVTVAAVARETAPQREVPTLPEFTADRNPGFASSQRDGHASNLGELRAELRPSPAPAPAEIQAFAVRAASAPSAPRASLPSVLSAPDSETTVAVDASPETPRRDEPSPLPPAFAAVTDARRMSNDRAAALVSAVGITAGEPKAVAERENFAVAAPARAAQLGEQNEIAVRTSLKAASKTFGKHSEPVGTTSANSVPAMYSSPAPTAVAPLDRDLSASVWEVAAGAADVAEIPSALGDAAPLEVSDAHRAVEVVLKAVEDVSARERSAVKLEFAIGDTELSVRVELREDQVRTTFHTDSPELQNALANEWQAAAAAGSDRGLRLAVPQFIDPGARSESSLAGDQSGRQQDRPGARGEETPTHFSDRRFSGGAHTPAPEPAGRDVTSAPAGTVRRLNHFA